MIARSCLWPSMLLALAAAQYNSEKTFGAQRNLRLTKAKPVMTTDTSDLESMHDEDLTGIWRSLQSETSMPIEVPSSAPSQSAPVPLPTSPVSAPVEVAPSMPSQSPVVVRTEAPVRTETPFVSTEAPVTVPVSVPTVSPVATTISDVPSLVPSQDFDDISQGPTSVETAVPSTSDPELRSDIPSDMPSDITSQIPSAIDPNGTDRPSLPPAFPCNSSPDLRELLMKVPLLGLSDEAVLDTEGTPQNEAFQWILTKDANFLCANDPMLPQRYSLAVFYYSTNGNRWSQCQAPADFTNEKQVNDANKRCKLEPLPDSGSNAWLTPGSECEWAGVVCNEDGFVEQLDIEQNGLAGTLPSELQHLSGLKILSLENGVISGAIPTEIATLGALEVLDLNFNLIGGSFPTELYKLSGLRQLDLNDNSLTGTIAPQIGDLRNLTFLQLHQNRFEGAVPSELGQLSLLEAASFESNAFEGSIPDSICGLASDGPLTSLSSDCLTEVQCSCCTQCF